MQWYYSKNGTQLGPIAQGELIAKLASGEVAFTELVWREGLADWIPASQVNELTQAAPVPPVPSAAPPVSSDSPYVPPVSNPVPLGYPSMPVVGSGKATASMVLGIVSLVIALCGCYGLVISVTCGILAVIFGGQVKKEAAINPGLAGDLGKAKAGVIMGWIGIGISVLFTMLMIALGVAGGAMEQMNK